jgi:hypothetical protein
MGLSGKTWSAEYLDIAPKYRDISSRILCTVEGPSQGLERVGRLSLLRTITENAQSNSGFVFARAEGEDLSTHFSFRHLYNGWRLASRKSKLGHICSLIVDANEEDELKELHGAGDWQATPDAVRVLNRLKRAHVVPPSFDGVRLTRGLYQRKSDSGCRFVVSPFVVGRTMDWRDQHRILIGSILNEQYFRYPAKMADLLRYLLKQPRTEQQIWAYCRRRWGASRAEIRKIIEQAKEDGILVICDIAGLADAKHQARGVVDLVPPLLRTDSVLAAAEDTSSAI